MQEVCVIFDIGKTNKKLIVFDKNYNIIVENQEKFEEILDDEGFVCDDLMRLSQWLLSSFEQIRSNTEYHVKALNFSTYGASLVHIGANGQAIAPLYNYLKAFPKELKTEFLSLYGPKETFFAATASPDLGMINSGLQLYWLKKQKIEIYKNIRYSLHLPQYCSYLFSNEPKSEFTSIGCHTATWDFAKREYHSWVLSEKLKSLALDPVKANEICDKQIGDTKIGVGIHDSSAALVPYVKSIKDQFILLSTGTWCIAINPFNESPVTEKELQMDCLNFISFDGKSVKASRLFSGNEHERQIKHLSSHFGVSPDYYLSVKFDRDVVWHLRKTQKQATPDTADLGVLMDCPFVERNLNSFKTFEEAYHQFILDLVAQQIASIKLIYGTTFPRKIFVDGGFAKNELFMEMMAEAFFDKEVYASEMAQASALGAAMVISEHWNPEHSSVEIKLKRYFNS